jgi:formylmethanofuran dehydrogenase subunit C
VSDRVELTLRSPLARTLDLAVVRADTFATLTSREIGALPVRYGSDAAVLGDFFTITGERAAQVRVTGDLECAEGVATGMASGELVIEGNVGRDVGLELAGGSVDVRGNAGANAAGARPGASRGAVGGELVIRGSAGLEAGAGMRRGLVVVMGDVGGGTGRAMIAGTVIVGGRVGAGAGRFLKRGSIVALGSIEPPETFRRACTYRPPLLRVQLRYLKRRYALPFTDAQINGRYDRYSGDFAELGKGEILQWVGA